MKLKYQTGFGNEFATEAVEGALPVGQNSPQKAPLGLYAEQFSGTAFTAPRVHNKRTWTYRIRPSVLHKPFRADRQPAAPELAVSTRSSTTPNQLRWDPVPIPTEPTDFVDGLVTIAGNGDSFAQTGWPFISMPATRAWATAIFYNADGEMLIVPEKGRLGFLTELGALQAGPGEIVVIPRGLKFRVEPADG